MVPDAPQQSAVGCVWIGGAVLGAAAVAGLAFLTIYLAGVATSTTSPSTSWGGFFSTTTQSPEYDCFAGLRNWNAGWSDSKKEFCCRTQMKGCSHESTTAAPSSTRSTAPLTTRSTTERPHVAAGPISCLVWGDPHIQTFDNSRVDFFGQGEVWMVKSSKVHIQARYLATPYTRGLAATNAIAIGGPLLKGHVLKVGPMQNGAITWDNAPICTVFPSGFIAPDGIGKVDYNGNGHLVDSAQGHLEKHIVHVQFSDVHLQIMRWENHINVRITMDRLDDQDGHCGNNNKDPSDDSFEKIMGRIGPQVAHDDLLFRTVIPLMPGKKPSLDDCEDAKRALARQACLKGNPDLDGDKLDACTFDACFGGPHYAAQDSVY